MPTITLPYTIQNGDVSDANKLAGNINAIVTEYNSTVGAASGDLIDESSTQTLDKKTFKSTSQTVVSNTDDTTVTFDLADGNVHTLILGGNRNLAITGATVGQYFSIELVQDGTGSRTVTWFSTISWVGGVAPTLTTTAGKKDTFMFRVTGTGTYDGYIVGMNI